MFARIVEASLRGRVLVLAAALVLLALGWRAARDLPVDVLPDLTRPMVTVQTETAGLAPEDVESLVTFPIETALSGLQDVARIRSVTSPGLSVVYAEFAWDSDPWRNRQLVAERIDAIRAQLAPSTTIPAEPRIGPLTSLMGEILLLSLQSPEGTASPEQLRELADWQLKPQLLALPGVAQVLAIGGEVKQYEIRPDPQRMQLNGVSLAQIDEAARGYGNNSGAGVAMSGGSEYALRGIGRPFRLEDLAQAAVAWRGNGSIRLGQVAELAEGARLKRGDAGYNGKPAVILSIQKQPGVDTLQLTQAVETLMRRPGALPAGVRADTVFRQADFIEESVSSLRQALLHGAVIVGLILLLFLAGGRATLVSLAAIPASVAAAILVLQAFGRWNHAMALAWVAHENLCLHNILRNANEAQKKKYLPGLCKGTSIGALGLTEPGAGSDALGSMSTTARREGGHYILNGRKIYITNGPVADVLLVYAKTDKDRGAKGISAFIVEKDFPGFKVAQKLVKMGFRGSQTAELVFDDCRVPAENLVGVENQGVKVVMSGLDLERSMISPICLGIAERALQISIDYAKQRKQFGKPISDFQMVRAKLADMYTWVESMRLFTYQTLRAANTLDEHGGGRGDIHKITAAGVLYVAETMNKVLNEGVQVHGGTGYIWESEINRLYRSIKLLEIGAGTSEVRKIIISEELLRE